jgi:hypothetical protein
MHPFLGRVHVFFAEKPKKLEYFNQHFELCGDILEGSVRPQVQANSLMARF